MTETNNKNKNENASEGNKKIINISLDEQIYNLNTNETLISCDNSKNVSEIQNQKQINLNLIKNALLKLKNGKKDNLINKEDKDNIPKKESKLLNKKRENSENEKDDNEIILKEENNEDDKESLEGNDINENEEEKGIDNDNVKSLENDDMSDNEEEDEDLYSISSDNISDTSFNPEDKSKLIKIYRRRNDNNKALKDKIPSYKEGNKNTILKRKKYYVHQLLQRWWYSLPMWPPENYDTSEKLRENNLRLVEEKNWKKEAEINSDNYKKCIELPGYKYVYLTKDGKVHDFRPEEGKPTFNNLMKLSDIELHQHIVNALRNQLDELEKNKFLSEKKLRTKIKNELKIAKKNLEHLKGKQK